VSEERISFVFTLRYTGIKLQDWMVSKDRSSLYELRLFWDRTLRKMFRLNREKGAKTEDY